MILGHLDVHFSPTIVARVGDDTALWADALRDWFHRNDPDRIFGRDSPNSRTGTFTWSRHLHVVPSLEVAGKAALLKWEQTGNPFHRTSDRLLIYSLSQDAPLVHGLFLIALLGDPGGHQRAFDGATAAGLRELWEDLAYSHQMAGALPSGALTHR